MINILDILNKHSKPGALERSKRGEYNKGEDEGEEGD